MPNVAALQPDSGRQQVARSAPADRNLSFHAVLSALNPLQYLPVIGTIYRAVTGDQIPEAVRRVGSFIASALIGGPIGAAINVAIMLAEKISGIDLDRTGQMLLTGNAQGDHPANQAAPVPAPVVHTAAPARPKASPAQAWSPAQLAAYGVGTAGDGAIKLADLRGAEVLNALELLRIRGARAAYARAVNLKG
ncbi:MAG TPA: hypothetical protein VND19_06500 [Acetobacteraceae bacterium]|nr:hypothetical protein [Acetobacteraceae bacterium]